MSVTFSVLKFLPRSRLAKDLQLLNICDMLVTFSVLKLSPKVIFFNFEHQLNILFKSVTSLALKLLKIISSTLKPENKLLRLPVRQISWPSSETMNTSVPIT